MDIRALAEEVDFPDHVEWVGQVAHTLRATTAAILEREPTEREMAYLLGLFLLSLVQSREKATHSLTQMQDDEVT